MSNDLPSINVQHSTRPTADALREAGLSPLLSPKWTGATLSPRSPAVHLPSTSAPDESLVQPGAQFFQLAPQLPGILTKIQRIGGGAYGNVFQGVWTHNKDIVPVAIKCIREAHLDDEENQQAREERFARRIKRETVIWQDAKHPNILPFVGYQIVDGEPMLVSPWCKNGSLNSYISNHPDITDVQKIKLLCDAAKGLAHLHSLIPPIAHGDIKPENVLVTDDIEAALCDFGISRVMASLGTHTGLTTSGQSAGTAGYQAKELYEENSRPTDRSDVYAFGGLILATMSGKQPFYQNRAAASVIIAINQNRTAQPAQHPALPADDPLWDLMRRCWASDLEKRPSMVQIIDELEGEIKRRIPS